MNVVKEKENLRKDIGGSMYKRCKMILKELENEGKIKVWWDFTFPQKEELKLRLKDMLEDEVDEKYYISETMLKGFLNHNEKHKEKGTGFIWKPKNENDIASTLRANASLCPTDNTIKCEQVGNLQGGKWDKINESCTRVYSEKRNKSYYTYLSRWKYRT